MPRSVSGGAPTRSGIALRDNIYIGTMALLGAFRGDPNGGGAVQWLPYDAGENMLLLDDTIANLPGGYRNTQCDFLSTLPGQ